MSRGAGLLRPPSRSRAITLKILAGNCFAAARLVSHNRLYMVGGLRPKPCPKHAARRTFASRSHTSSRRAEHNTNCSTPNRPNQHRTTGWCSRSNATPTGRRSRSGGLPTVDGRLAGPPSTPCGIYTTLRNQGPILFSDRPEGDRRPSTRRTTDRRGAYCGG